MQHGWVFSAIYSLFILSPPLDYFSQHLGEYLNVLSALESLNIAILKAMDKTKQVRLWKNIDVRLPLKKVCCELFDLI